MVDLVFLHFLHKNEVIKKFLKFIFHKNSSWKFTLNLKFRFTSFLGSNEKNLQLALLIYCNGPQWPEYYHCQMLWAETISSQLVMILRRLEFVYHYHSPHKIHTKIVYHSRFMLCMPLTRMDHITIIEGVIFEKNCNSQYIHKGI